ncbi:fungal-specific transcription factor domain-containing protein, partial [Neohortaea acidophila]
MATDDTSPSLSASTTLTNGDSAQPLPSHHSQSHSHAKQKRARSQLSCTPCRQGKLKCNRQQDPACDQCIKRNRESACLFVPPPVKHKQAQNVKGRIRQLESLVVDLMNQNRGALQTRVGETSSGVNGSATTSEPARAPLPYSQPTPPSDSDTSPQFGTERSRGSADSPDDVDAATGPLGQMTISKNEISYVGESHWGAILNSISDLKRDIGGEEEDEESGNEDDDAPPTVNVWGLRNDTLSAAGAALPRDATQVGFMIGNHTTMTKDQLIAAMPEKKVVDRLLSLWFNSPDPFKPIIHAPTFQDEYRRFWKSPKDTPVMWIALLYAIMSLAASFGLRDLDPRHPQAQTILKEVSQYHTFAASALVLGDFTKPKQHTLECMMLYAAGLRSNDAFVNVWLLIGLVARLAMRMGYHRDASSYPSISVFQGEMRRRIWTIISMIDVMISFQIGLPSIIKTIHSDTQPPRNLLDRDFGPSTQQLPPSRSMDELTPSSYTRAKLRIVRVFADAADLGHSTIPPSTEEVMRLDRELEEAKAAKPPLLQMPDISELVTDPAEQLMCRFNLDLLYLKTKIPGGQLESVKWYMGSISTHDFLLAAMVMCLEL